MVNTIEMSPETGFPLESSKCPCSVKSCGTAAIALPAESPTSTITAPVARLTLPIMLLPPLL
jgi:hypothetical protein